MSSVKNLIWTSIESRSTNYMLDLKVIQTAVLHLKQLSQRVNAMDQMF